MTPQEKTIYLVDGSAYVYRAYHSHNLSTSSGEPTGAVYGVVSMLKRIIRDYSPDYLVVVFDAKGKTFRDDIYPHYKENRPPMPDDLRAQYEVIRQLVAAMGIKTMSISGVEADDVIGTLATAARDAGLLTVIASSDKDLAQLVTDRIAILDEKNGVKLGPSQVKEKFGVLPTQIIDYLSLVGDSSDNIPGVPLVGKVTAAKWLAMYGSLDSIIENADSFSGKAGENLRNSLEQLELARTLVTLKLDVDVELDTENFTITSGDMEQLRGMYTRLEFHSWLKNLEVGQVEKKQPVIQYSCVTDKTAFENLVERLANSEVFAFDTETTGLDMRHESLVGISVSVQAWEAFYIPVAHNYPGVASQLDQEWVIEKLKPVFENPEIGKIVQNLKFDAVVFAKYGITVRGVVYDTMIESYVLNSTAVSKHSLDNLSLKYLNHTTVKFEDVAGKKGKNQLTFDRIEIDTATHYAAEDADIAFRLHEALWPQLQNTGRLQDVFEIIDMPLAPVLMRMEDHGVRIDRDELGRQSADLHSRIQSVEQKIYESAGTKFNVSSPKQIREVLFDVLGYQPTSKTSQGHSSTSEAVLNQLAMTYDVPRLILEYRSLAKLKSTYTDKLPNLIHPATGRVHTSYHQAVAATGRLSSLEPNLQNIPIRTAEGRRIREAFVVDPGCILISIDYSQIELRIMAHLSEDPGLVDAFAKGEDVHRFTASEVFDARIDQVTSDQRRHAKAINFGLMYGMSPFGLARQLQIDVAQAQEYVEQYFARYPKVREFMDNTRTQAHSEKFVETIYGRRLNLADINAKHYGRRQHAERTAINAPLQGSAADIIKLAMIEVDRWITTSECRCRMIMQVHDELVLEVPESEQNLAVENVKAIMENATELRVPLVADVGIGTNWASAHQ